MSASDQDPIIAIATAPGRGGIGIVRISGNRLEPYLNQWFARPVTPRFATLRPIPAIDGSVIDEGILLFFPAPHSYTGEDVLELQVHGGPAVLSMLVADALVRGKESGMRLAEPGEFTRRAYLNDKLDLAQAEAVADLIEANTSAAARSARLSLSGTFSALVAGLVGQVVALRTLVEATLDFPEEEIEFLERSDALGKLRAILKTVEEAIERSTQGAILRQGIKIVIAGRPNVGKSSLLNALADAEVAIVSSIPGTTRDRVTQTIQIEGIELHIIDTAGLRDTDDEVERIGIARTWSAIAEADVVLNVRDAQQSDTPEDLYYASRLDQARAMLVVYNKIDCAPAPPERGSDSLGVSAKTGEGIAQLRQELLRLAGWHSSAETVFLARERHLVALRNARDHLSTAVGLAARGDAALDLVAEELRLAQHQLSAITGEFSADDLLGEIFGRFCIGK